MDYHSVHGHDISSFDLPLPHRLPTVSAADALEQLMTDRSRRVPTGLDALDRALSGFSRHVDAHSPLPGGFSNGQVIEVWGPPASGKTTFGLQLAAGVLKHGRNVVWVDAFHPLCGTRLHQMTHAASASSASPASGSEAERRDVMLHFTCPSLAHFIALLCRPTRSCVPPKTSLIVVDSLSALVNQAFPRNQEPRDGPYGGPHRATQRLQMLQLIMTNLQKLAATRDITIVILTQSATRMQSERGATLTPALNARAWDQGIATRLVLFRDWMFRDGVAVGFHFAGIQKLNGKTHQDGLGDVFPFRIQEDGLVGVDFEPLLGSPRDSLLKRKLGDTDFDVADREDDEDYGWDAEDADHVPIPPQWQGSEDLLVGQHDDEGNRIDDVSDGAGAYYDDGGLTDE